MHRTWKRFRESLLARVNDMTVKDLVVELKRKRRSSIAAGDTAC